MVKSLSTWGELFGYRLFFWSNENDEPVHIHVCKGVPTPNATKIWIPPTGNPIIAHNHGNIPTKDLNRLRKGVAANKESIVCSRRHFFSLVSYPEAKEIPPIFRYIQ